MHKPCFCLPHACQIMLKSLTPCILSEVLSVKKVNKKRKKTNKRINQTIFISVDSRLITIRFRFCIWLEVKIFSSLCLRFWERFFCFYCFILLIRFQFLLKFLICFWSDFPLSCFILFSFSFIFVLIFFFLFYFFQFQFSFCSDSFFLFFYVFFNYIVYCICLVS